MLSKFKILIFFAFAIFLSNASFAQESEKIDAVLAKKRAYKKENPEGKGFKIQLYNGDETNAYRIQKEYELEFENDAELTYETPEWKVRVGNYLTRLEADRALLEIKLKFTVSIVLETEIKL